MEADEGWGNEAVEQVNNDTWANGKANEESVSAAAAPVVNRDRSRSPLKEREERRVRSPPPRPRRQESRSPPPPAAIRRRARDDDRRPPSPYRRDRSRSPRGRRRSRTPDYQRRRHSPAAYERRRSPDSREYRRPVRHEDTPSDPSNILGVFGLNPITKSSDVEELFKEFGTINRVHLIDDRQTGNPRGFGFVYFENIEDAKRALEKTNGMEFLHRRIRVDFSKTKKPHSPTPGHYMGRRRSFSRSRSRSRGRYDDRRREPSYRDQSPPRRRYPSRSRSPRRERRGRSPPRHPRRRSYSRSRSR